MSFVKHLFFFVQYIIHFIVQFSYSIITHRFYTTVQKDAIKYGLGRPVCGNFFYAAWDESVDKTIRSFRPPFPGYLTRGLADVGLLAYFTNLANRNADGSVAVDIT